MLVIRFQRFGKKRQPTFRVVVKEQRASAQGKYLENLGWYDPRSKKLSLHEERIRYWLSHGAQASNTAWNLFLRAGLLAGEKRAVHKKPKKQ